MSLRTTCLIFCFTLCMAATFARVNAQTLGSAERGTAKVGYNPATGEVVVSAFDVFRWAAFGPNLNQAAAYLPPNPEAETIYEPNGVGQKTISDFTFTDANLGPIASVGFDASSFTGFSSQTLVSPVFQTAAAPLNANGHVGPALPGQIVFGYDPVTGSVVVSVNSVFGWYIQAGPGAPNFDGASPTFPAEPTGGTVLTTDNARRVGQTIFADNLAIFLSQHSLGAILKPGLDPAQVSLRYETSFNSRPVTVTAVAIIPEPSQQWAAACCAAIVVLQKVRGRALRQRVLPN